MKYRVLNPHDIPKGVHILRHCQDPDKPDQDLFWFEDNVFEKPDTMQAAIVTDWIKAAFLERISE
jgi:hypothetical protein